MAASPPRRRLIGLSTKMYFSLSRTRDFVSQFLQHLSAIPPDQLSQVDVFVIPDFVSLAATVDQLKACPAAVWPGAQDCHWEDQGAFTGEVSPAVLGEAGVRIVEVGHAERRRMFGEDDATVALKAAAVSRNAMVPLVCIGEQTRGDVSVAVDECRRQVEAVVAALGETADMVLAYEPVWAIGASQPAGEEHVLSVVDGIRALDCVRDRKGSTRVVYGGSAGPGLYQRLSKGLDGLFLGRFGHDPERFVQTIREVIEA
ncbi:triosephosphate isomerase domain-containing protein [Hirsutella rhossiliensis]|uniref:Triosephosphate isomerase n=1 Tax=Hirsutella rhossiliensis TaxID=111463 RepID=A0A9P8SNC3_9HYPO|nr:triosephosphate isomerase domain-containing protein [Hirsutella rhossiliensis]KAH0967730.1 triosephosphate isomerase domain-containing protein [Hirsutella rhossiliensis]